MEGPMIVIVLLAVALVALRFWARMDKMSAAIADLTARLYALEQRQATAARSKAADETRSTVSVTPSQSPVTAAPPAHATAESPSRPPTPPAVSPQPRVPAPSIAVPPTAAAPPIAAAPPVAQTSVAHTPPIEAPSIREPHVAPPP